jgi:uncharacterized protein YybS (DUF2232 family)
MKIKDVLGCVGWAAFLLLSSIWIPFIGPFLSLLTPLPFLYYSTKLGFYRGIKLAGLTILIIALIAKLAGYPQIIVFAVELGFFGLVLSELFRRQMSIGKTVFCATSFMVLLGLVILFFIALSKNMGPMEMMLKYLQDHLNETIRVYKEMGVSQENAVEFEAFGKAFVDTISRIYPSLMIVGTGFAVWLNIVISKPLFRIGKLPYPDYFLMDRWQAPDHLVWVVIASGFALFFASGGIQSFAINALIIMMAIYLFHGLSILLFFLNKYHVPNWIRVGVYMLIMIQQLFLGLLALAGLFDQWVDFRKIHRRMES